MCGFSFHAPFQLVQERRVGDGVRFGEGADAKARVAAFFDIDIPKGFEYHSFFLCEVFAKNMAQDGVSHGGFVVSGCFGKHLFTTNTNMCQPPRRASPTGGAAFFTHALLTRRGWFI